MTTSRSNHVRVKRFTTVLFSLVLAAGATSALAGANDADVTAKVNVFDFHAKAFADRVASGAWGQAGYAIDHMADAIKSIKKLDPTRDVSALAKRLDAARAALDAHEKQAQGESDNAKKIEGVEREHKDAIYRVQDLERLPKSVMKKRDLDELVAALRELDQVDRTCKEIAASRPSCVLAARRVAIAKATLDVQLETAIAAELADIAKAREALANDGTILPDRARFHDVAALEKTWNGRYTGLAEIVGTPVSADRFRPILDGAAQYLGDIPKAARTSRLPKGMGATSAVVVKDVAATYPKAKVLKVIASGSWDVVLDDFKRPTRRDAHGAALIQEAGESHCRMVLLLVTAPYQGGGYGPTRLDNVHSEYQVSACR